MWGGGGGGGGGGVKKVEKKKFSLQNLSQDSDPCMHCIDMSMYRKCFLSHKENTVYYEVGSDIYCRRKIFLSSYRYFTMVLFSTL